LGARAEAEGYDSQGRESATFRSHLQLGSLPSMRHHSGLGQFLARGNSPVYGKAREKDIRAFLICA
jgi:hypothetical protein